MQMIFKKDENFFTIKIENKKVLLWITNEVYLNIKESNQEFEKARNDLELKEMILKDLEAKGYKMVNEQL